MLMARPAKTRRPASKLLLTEVELELMTIVWHLGSATVNEVLAELPARRNLAYTSVSTILRILEQKGVLASEKVGRGHVYRPLVARADYEIRAVKDVVGRVFGGQPLSLVRALMASGVLGDGEIEALRATLGEGKEEP
jgi:predicted transcriptional regulator